MVRLKLSRLVFSPLSGIAKWHAIVLGSSTALGCLGLSIWFQRPPKTRISTALNLQFWLLHVGLALTLLALTLYTGQLVNHFPAQTLLTGLSKLGLTKTGLSARASIALLLTMVLLSATTWCRSR